MSKRAQDNGTDLTNIAPLYSGIGNVVEVEIKGAKIEIPIEPVEIIVIGIDGLRQDVLYAPDEQQVKETGANYYVKPTLLKGLCEVLGGKYDSDKKNCDITGAENKHVKLQNVTAIFPSITFASWASIFTGMMPGTTLDNDGKNIGWTGIVGNEFFARDLIEYDSSTGKYKWKSEIPAMGRNPIGMVTISDGAFKKIKWEIQALTPLSGKWQKSPQNNLLQTDTVYEALNENEDFKKYFKGKEGKSTVVVFQHYARGADEWVTLNWWDVRKFLPSVAYGLDEIPGDNAEKWLKDNLLSGISPFKKRNDKPFPGIFVLYFAGLDHEAHFDGMSGYTKFFKGTTDDEIKDIVNWLKKYGELDNKIFIITADHGHTAMPEFGEVTLPDGRTVEPDTSCKLRVEGFNEKKYQDAEKYNNNLHIWELGEVLKAVGEKVGLNYKVLAPEPIAQLFKDKSEIELPYGATKDTSKANVITAMNGPMAHIYLKNNDDWQTTPSDTELGYLALLFQRIFAEDGTNLDESLRVKLKNKFPRLLSSTDKILIRISGVYKVFKGLDITGKPITEELTTLTGPEYVKALERIGGANHPQRSGDIILLMKDKTSDGTGQRYSTGSACKSWHGSLNPSDSYVPVIVAYPGGNKYELEPLIDSTEGCSLSQGCDGNWRTTDLILEIIKRQYE